MAKTKDELAADIAAAEQALAAAQAALIAWESDPQNNVFASLDEAAAAIEDALLDQAHEDCEGSYNCGNEKYTREFIVDGTTYIGTLTVEYNRHDKTYYYVDGSEFTFAPKAEA